MRGAGDGAEAGIAPVGSLPVPSPRELAALDDEEPPARTRRAFVWITFAAGVVCLMPRQWASGAICLAISLALHLWDRRRSGGKAPPTSAKAPPPDGDGDAAPEAQRDVA